MDPPDRHREAEPTGRRRRRGRDEIRQIAHRRKRLRRGEHVRGERPDRIEGRAQRDDTGRVRGPGRGLEADHAAQRRRNPDRSSGVGPHRPIAHPERDRDGGASRGSAGHARRIAWVVHRPVVRVGAGHAVGPFVQIGFPDHDAPMPPHPCDERRVLGVGRPGQHASAGRGHGAPDPDVVLDRDDGPGPSSSVTEMNALNRASWTMRSRASCAVTPRPALGANRISP